jgi:hypothetical protein
MDTSTLVTGVSGAVYAPIDTSPQATAVNQAMSLIQEGLAQLTTLINSLDKRIGENPPQNLDLQTTVDLVLHQSAWFDNKVAEFLKSKDDLIENVIEDVVRDRMDTAVNDWFNNEFQLSDYVDIEDLVKEVVEEKLRRATITVDI